MVRILWYPGLTPVALAPVLEDAEQEDLHLELEEDAQAEELEEQQDVDPTAETSTQQKSECFYHQFVRRVVSGSVTVAVKVDL